MKKGIKIIKDMLFIKTILFFSALLLTGLFTLAFILNDSINTKYLFILFCPSIFILIIYLFVWIMYNSKKKEEVQLYRERIIIYLENKKYELNWNDVQSISKDKISFGSDSLIMELLIYLLRNYYIIINLNFKENCHPKQISFCYSKRKVNLIYNLIKNN